jgi:hypothetical protein
MFTDQTYRQLGTALANFDAASEIESVLSGHPMGKTYFVNADPGASSPRVGHDSNSGLSTRTPFLTMARALAAAQAGDRIAFWGDVREQLTIGRTLIDMTFIGLGSLHHPDSPGAGYKRGGAMWRMPASGGTETTPLAIVRGRGCNFINIAFDGPDTAAAVQLVRTAEGSNEYDASHATFRGCRFLHGQNHIEDNGGVYNLTIKNCELAGASAASILNVTGAGIGTCLNWKILNNIFPGNVSDFGNATHIDAGMNAGIIAGNIFGTVRSTAKYVDLTGGAANVVVDNTMGGLYDTTDYVSGTGDLWYHNRTVVKAVTSPDGLSLTVPGA